MWKPFSIFTSGVTRRTTSEPKSSTVCFPGRLPVLRTRTERLTGVCSSVTEALRRAFSYAKVV